MTLLSVFVLRICHSQCVVVPLSKYPWKIQHRALFARVCAVGLSGKAHLHGSHLYGLYLGVFIHIQLYAWQVSCDSTTKFEDDSSFCMGRTWMAYIMKPYSKLMLHKCKGWWSAKGDQEEGGQAFLLPTVPRGQAESQKWSFLNCF